LFLVRANNRRVPGGRVVFPGGRRAVGKADGASHLPAVAGLGGERGGPDVLGAP